MPHPVHAGTHSRFNMNIVEDIDLFFGGVVITLGMQKVVIFY